MSERTEVQIRSNREPDRFTIVSLIEENGLVDGHAVGYLQGILDKRRVAVAEADGEVVGAIVAHGPDKNGSSDINYVAVHQDFRGRGIGQSLVEHTESILRSMNATRIRLLAYQAKPELVTFYQKLGFQLVTADGEMKKTLR